MILKIFKLNKNWLFWSPILLGLLVLYVPTYQSLAINIWSTEEQGHGPIILIISLFFIWNKRSFFFGSDNKEMKPNKIFGSVFLLVGLSLYIVGSSQGLLFLEALSQIFVLFSILLLVSGIQGAKVFWFPLLFLVFLLPLPASFVDALTLPMKIAVSNLAEFVLYNLGYPIARDGVVLQIGFYKLLVADACAGLHTVFTLEAMGLLYLHLIKRDSFVRNVSLAILIVPIAFFANVVRVMILVLITHYYGDEVGQGFIHDFAGFVLFATALMFIIGVDSVIHYFERKYKKKLKAN
ncbi:Eight transmembrane protein EpsH [hydrothermal vent metagenome]|uniref:Eight transmembrane protein EpsH n=1 Tax=hydrothermal vent metagenome TaxID=652676 RepID=A0A3B0WBF1_9ZZZZ